VGVRSRWILRVNCCWRPTSGNQQRSRWPKRLHQVVQVLAELAGPTVLTMAFREYLTPFFTHYGMGATPRPSGYRPPQPRWIPGAAAPLCQVVKTVRRRRLCGCVTAWCLAPCETRQCRVVSPWLPDQHRVIERLNLTIRQHVPRWGDGSARCANRAGLRQQLRCITSITTFVCPCQPPPALSRPAHPGHASAKTWQPRTPPWPRG